MLPDAAAVPESPGLIKAGTHRLLEVVDLQVRFARGGRLLHAVNGVSYAVDTGQSLAIIGESGSGKTVSCRAIMGLLPRYASISGSAKLAGTELIGLTHKELRRHRGNDVAMVFQDSGRSLNPTMRVGRQIAEAVGVHQAVSRRQAKLMAVDLMKRVRIPAAARRFDDYPHQLSGGMRQRIMIAIALSCNPRLLIADEATTALDVTTQAQIMDLLISLQEERQMGLILISHDMGIAASYSDHVVVMYGGRVAEEAPTRDLFHRVRMPYTKVLLEAVPRLDRVPHELFPTVRGAPPNLAAAPTCCAFSTRCPSAQDRCRSELPSLEGQGTHRWACFYPAALAGEN